MMLKRVIQLEQEVSDLKEEIRDLKKTVTDLTNNSILGSSFPPFPPRDDRSEEFNSDAYWAGDYQGID